MKTLKPLLVALFMSPALFAQDQPAPENNTHSLTSLEGLLRTQATITPAWSVTGFLGDESAAISGGRTNIYIHGTAEYYFTNRFSLRGDAFYFVNKSKDPGGMKHNHSLQIGGSWHLLKKSLIDPFIGVRSGMSLVQINPLDIPKPPTLVWEEYPVPMSITPTWGPHVGINFFGQRIFHFFVEAQYLMGTYRPLYGPQLSLGELRVSAGLGWNWVIYKNRQTIHQKI